MVAEDGTITEEVAADLVVEEVLRQEEKETLLQDVKVLVAADLEATETQHHVKVVLVEEVILETQRQEEKVVFLADLQEPKVQVHLTERQDVLKVLETHQDQEDQEKTNIYLLIFL